MEKFFYAPSSWDLGEAEKHARHIGLETKREGRYLLIERRYNKAEFQWDGEEDLPSFTGYWMEMESWNGWKVPLFPKKTVEKLRKYLDDTNDDPDAATIEWDGEDIKVNQGGDITVISPHEIKVNNKQVTVYDFGLGWTWDIKENV